MKINIADSPAKPRDHSRLMVIGRKSGYISHHKFYELPKLLKPSDVLVFNNSKVIPARLYGHKITGGKVEILLLRKLNSTDWEYISHPGLKPHQVITISPKLKAKIISPNKLKFSTLNSQLSTSDLINQIGHTPLPPYIHSGQPESVLRRQYQTVYAKDPGSAAAPTAGLHFTPHLLSQLSTLNFQLEFVTLHVGLGTFKSPTPEQLESSHLHKEYFELNRETAQRLNNAKSKRRRVIAVGTTACRVLESCTGSDGRLTPQSGDTDIFIRPGYRFKFIDGLLTNFHLPGSSLLMLISAFSSPKIIKSAYHTAINLKYRFYSFGDATLII